MKKLLVLSLYLASTLSFSSDRWSCEYTAEITAIKKIDTLNITTSGNFRQGIDNATYLATLKLSDGQNPTGSSMTCRNIENKKILLEEEKKYEYKIGQKLKIRLSGGNDRSGSFYSSAYEL